MLQNIQKQSLTRGITLTRSSIVFVQTELYGLKPLGIPCFRIAFMKVLLFCKQLDQTFHHQNTCQSKMAVLFCSPQTTPLSLWPTFFWRIWVIQEMITDCAADSPYTFLEEPPSHTPRCQEFPHAFVKRWFIFDKSKLQLIFLFPNMSDGVLEQLLCYDIRAASALILNLHMTPYLQQAHLSTFICISYFTAKNICVADFSCPLYLSYDPLWVSVFMTYILKEGSQRGSDNYTGSKQTTENPTHFFGNKNQK